MRPVIDEHGVAAASPCEREIAMAENPKVTGDSRHERGNGEEMRPPARATNDPAERQPASAAERYRMIEAGAYFRAEKRGFAPGHEIRDWLAAEREVDDKLSGEASAEPMLDRLRRERDELRVRIHLAKLDLRQEWDALECKWDLVKARSGGALREARGAGKEVGTAAGALLGEIREGYKRIRAAL